MHETVKLILDFIKKYLIICGVGAIVLMVLIVIGRACNDRDEKTMLTTPGECVSNKQFEVIKVYNSGDALAAEIYELDFGTGLEVMFLNDGSKSYYDGQIITIPEGKCARQIGVYRYKDYDGTKTVPIVKIDEE